MKTLNLLYSRHNVNTPPTALPVRKSNFNDLTLLIKGTLEYTVEGKKYVLKAGDMMFIPVGSTHFRTKTPDSTDYVAFNFTTDSEIHLPIYCEDVIHTEILMLISAFDRIKSRTYYDNDEKISHILACIIAVLEDRIRSRNYNPLTLKILKYIHTNIDKKITLSDISEMTFFSPIYCDTVFKRETGKSIIDYLLGERIERAKKLLLEDGLTLAQISELVGFNDYNYFSRVFKARSGLSPSSYRQMTRDSIKTQ